MPEVLTQQVISHGIPLHFYYHPGSQSLPALVFLHGWRVDGTIWLPLLNSLGERFSWYALDLPGFGKSPVPPGSFLLQDYADVVKDFLVKCNISKAVLIGHSFGGRVAIKLACSHPERVEKLVLVASAGIRQHKARNIFFKFMAKLVKPFFLAFPRFSSLRHKLYRLIGAEDYVMRPELKEVFVRVISEDLLRLLPLIKHQTLLIWGRHDTESSLSQGQLMLRYFPNASLKVFESSGHFPFLDEKERFIQELLQFLHA